MSCRTSVNPQFHATKISHPKIQLPRQTHLFHLQRIAQPKNCTAKSSQLLIAFAKSLSTKPRHKALQRDICSPSSQFCLSRRIPLLASLLLARSRLSQAYLSLLSLSLSLPNLCPSFPFLRLAAALCCASVHSGLEATVRAFYKLPGRLYSRKGRGLL